MNFKKYFLPLVVFITGAAVLVIEVVAVRILSPYYGNTIFAVSSVLSVILLALSAGYYIGGRLADKHQSQKVFFTIIAVSGIAVLGLHFIGKILLPLLSIVTTIVTGPLISSIILFLIPGFLLGMLSPFALTLQRQFEPEVGVGTIAGKIFFFSTVGSIAGSLLAGFLLIPQFGLDSIMIGNGIVLFILGTLPLIKLKSSKALLRNLLLFFIIVLVAGRVDAEDKRGIVYQKDGVYEKIAIEDGVYKGQPARFLQQDRSSSGAMFLNSNELVYGYTQYVNLYKTFNTNVKEALVIGGGAYSIPKAILGSIPEARVEVAEIEPGLFNLAKKYFRLSESPRLTNHIEDGRRLLKESGKNYDLIFSDVYYSLYSIPSHFTTKEFFELANEKLNDEGIFIANLIGSLKDTEPSFVLSEIKTMQSVFPQTFFFATVSGTSDQPQNIIAVGFKSERTMDELREAFGDKLIDMSKFDLSKHKIFTDNYAPVEYYISKIIRESY